MRIRTLIIGLLTGLVLISILSIQIPQTVRAQGCTDPRGNPVDCPDTARSKPGSKNHATVVPTTVPTATKVPTAVPSATQVPTAVPTATLVALPNKGGSVGPIDSNSLPLAPGPAPEAGNGSSPFNWPTFLGVLIAVLLILGGLFFGLLLPAIRKALSKGSATDKMKEEAAELYRQAEENRKEAEAEWDEANSAWTARNSSLSKYHKGK
jgi:DNA replication initiation complex subunit (GINS family)